MKSGRGGICRGGVILLLLLGAGGPACHRGPGSDQTPPVATVNGTKISLADLEEALRPVLVNSPSFSPIETSAWEALKFNALNQLVERNLLVQEAHQKGIKLADKELEAREAEIRKDYPQGEFEKVLLSRFIDYERWRQNLRDDLLIQKLIENSVPVSPVTGFVVSRYYQRHQDQYQVPVQVRARQIVVRTEQEAQAAREELLKGGDFAKLARRLSLSPDAEQGGDLGFFSAGVMPPEFDQVVFSLPPGKISQVVKSPYGYHLFLVEEVRESKALTEAQVKEKIRELLARETREKSYQDWLQKLKEKAEIKVNQALVKEKINPSAPLGK
ncbi:MAG: peptidylprolyl isomerase [Proteobacteria bacterium]|nr:peptidylprolyl isomerase [Pseudomonadota bacterium]